MLIVHAFTVFSSAFLLFLVQPIIAKQVLPWFGGSAAVWTTCLVFFQSVLFAGYAYADLIVRKLAPRGQALLHIGLLLLSLSALPILADEAWKPTGAEEPIGRILGLLAVTIGLPYFVLSTTGPLVQAWFARHHELPTVYRLYALSNLASLAALVAYPFALEPWITTAAQARWWSVGFALFVVSCVASAALSVRRPSAVAVPAGQSAPDVKAAEVSAAEVPRPSLAEHLVWLMLAAMGATMLLVVSHHVTHDLASVPFLWVVPLSLYLLTFILCFEGRGWYSRRAFLVPVMAAAALMAWNANSGTLRAGVPIALVGLFVACMFFHGELALRKPHPRHLTRFYLMMSLGGALGGMVVGLVTVQVFDAQYEFGIALVVTALIALIVTRRSGLALRALAAVMLAFTVWQVGDDVSEKRASSLLMERNFYGSLRVKDVPRSEPTRRIMMHGAVIHGEQHLAPARALEPTAYYGETSGVGRAIEALRRPGLQVGVIGLGAGTLAVYGREGDRLRFYEINPDVVDAAHLHFSFLKTSQAKLEHVLGDARLALEREVPQGFDLLVVDAFSSDSIPVHLATLEAFRVYQRHLAPGGVIAFHITNQFIALAPALEQIAARLKLHSALVVDEGEKPGLRPTDWFLVTAEPKVLGHAAIAGATRPVERVPGLDIWTDDFNNLFRLLKF